MVDIRIGRFFEVVFAWIVRQASDDSYLRTKICGNSLRKPYRQSENYGFRCLIVKTRRSSLGIYVLLELVDPQNLIGLWSRVLFDGSCLQIDEKER